MKIPSNKILPLFLRYGLAVMFFVTIISIALFTNFTAIREPYSWDEQLFWNTSHNFTVNHIKDIYYNVMEAKPLTFLVLQKALNSSDPVYTRTFAYVLIMFCTFLMYALTRNRLALLYVFIPIFLDSMWLTAEIIEVTLVLLSMYYVNKSGIFIGLATIFRPSAILYTILLKRIQWLYVLVIGILFTFVLYILNLLDAYIFEVTHYVGDSFYGVYALVVIMLILLVFMGFNKVILPYVLVSATSLSIKMFPHYFLPIYTFLFIGFLLNMNDDIKMLRNYTA